MPREKSFEHWEQVECDQEPELLDTLLEYRHDPRKSLKLPYWVLPNKQGFSQFIQNTFSPALAKVLPEQKGLKRHQAFVSQLMQEGSPYRGLLLYHGLGSGKTAASLFIADNYERQYVIMLPASLRSNYKLEIERFANFRKEETKHKVHWCWVPCNDVDAFCEEYPQFEGKEELVANMRINLHERPKKYGGASVAKPKKRKEKWGIWLSDSEAEPNYDNLHEDPALNEELQRRVDETVDFLYAYKYHFVNYNAGRTVLPSLFTEGERRILSLHLGEGVTINQKTWTRVLDIIHDPETPLQNPFSNKIIIVDEIHNFISRILGGGYTCRALYPLMMSAVNAKFVFLSGTPAINDPCELGILLNLLRGNVDSYYYKLTSNTLSNRARTTKYLQENPYVDYYDFVGTGSTTQLMYTRMPHGFRQYQNTSGVSQVGPYSKYPTPNQLYKNISSELAKYRPPITLEEPASHMHTHTLFSSFTEYLAGAGKIKIQNELVRKEFAQRYIDHATNNVKNVVDFRARIVGLVSFFNETTDTDADGHSIFPSLITPYQEGVSTKDPHTTIRIVEQEMSNYQFMRYCEAREEERKTEKSSKPGQDENATTASYFKVMSRNYGLFVFPPQLERLWPRDIKAHQVEAEQLEKEAIESDEGGFTVGKEVASYAETKAALLEGLSSRPEYLTMNDTDMNLAVLAPKYVSILSKVESAPGLVMCYSQFRTLEGIEVFSRVLHANGYRAFEPTETLEWTEPEGDAPMLRVCMDTDLWITIRASRVGGDSFEIPVTTAKTRLNDVLLANGQLHEERFQTVYVTQADRDAYIDGLEIFTGVGDTVTLRHPEQTFAQATYGVLDPHIRDATIKAQSAVDNRHGQHLHVLLLTLAGAEGISLHNIRTVFIMEPFWNMVKMNQVIGRARRNNSHRTLPIEQRNVRVYEYISTFSKKQLGQQRWTADDINDAEAEAKASASGAEEEKGADEVAQKEMMMRSLALYSADVVGSDHSRTSDQALYDIAIRKQSVMTGFLRLLKEAAIDCEWNKEPNEQTDRSLRGMQCLRTEDESNVPHSTPPDSTIKFIYAPGKSMERTSTKDDVRGVRLLESSIMIPLPHIPTEYGVLEISGMIFHGHPHQIYDPYAYYKVWLETGTPEPTQTPIGTYELKGQTELEVTLAPEFTSKTHLLRKYNTYQLAMQKRGDMPHDDDAKKQWWMEVFASYTAPTQEKPTVEIDPYDVLGVEEGQRGDLRYIRAKFSEHLKRDDLGEDDRELYTQALQQIITSSRQRRRGRAPEPPARVVQPLKLKKDDDDKEDEGDLSLADVELG